MFSSIITKTFGATNVVSAIKSRAITNSAIIPTTARVHFRTQQPHAIESVAPPPDATNAGFKSKFAIVIQEGNKHMVQDIKDKAKMSKIARKLEEYDERVQAERKAKEGEKDGVAKKVVEGEFGGEDKMGKASAKDVGKVGGCNGGCVKCKCGVKA